jgi:hypothetical protein
VGKTETISKVSNQQQAAAIKGFSSRDRRRRLDPRPPLLKSIDSFGLISNQRRFHSSYHQLINP